MKFTKKTLKLMLCLTLSLGIIGCSAGGAKSNKTPEEVFADKFSKAINLRWDEQDKLANKTGVSEQQRTDETVEILNKEKTSINEALTAVEDTDLKKLGEDYVKGLESQIEMFKTNEIELQIKYSEESNALRKPSLIKLVDEYGVVIEEKHEQTYKDFKAQANVINKENDAKAYAEKLAAELKLESQKDEYGDIEYTAIIENTSENKYKSLSYDVQYKDGDDIVIGSDYIHLDNFTPGSKQKIKLNPYVKGKGEIAKVSIIFSFMDVE